VPRHAEVVVDLDAVAHNVHELRSLAGSAEFCAVVKADGYGHGAVPVARAALDAGATSLAVALVEEGAALRDAGIDAPILLLSEPPVDALRDAWKLALTPTLYHEDSVEVASEVVHRHGRWGVHIKVDTGMHRVGAPPEDAVHLAAKVVSSRELVLEGVFTHLAVADEPERAETAEQLELFARVCADMRDRGIDTGTVHAANSAGLIAHPEARLDMVRCGIAMYGLAPSRDLAAMVDLRPAMSVVAEVSHFATVAAGDGVSYGLRHRFDRDTVVAVVPVGYADGVSRRLAEVGGEVLIGGHPRAMRGAVTMDQFVVEVGPAGGGPGGLDPAASAAPVSCGDEVVLLGHQGGAEVTATQWADRLGTINYEVACGFSARLPRRYP